MRGAYERAIIRAVADTHALIWYFYADPRMSVDAYKFIEAVDAVGDQIAVSSITFVEIIYLMEKGKIPATTLAGILAEFNQLDSTFIEIPVDRDIVHAMPSIPRADVPDMPDRIIAATAVALGVPVVSRDGRIRLSNVPTIW